MVRLTTRTDALDAGRVLRLYSVCRGLRALRAIAAISVFVWPAYCAITKSGYADDSAVRTRLDEQAVIGVLVALGLIVVASVGLLVTRRRGPEGALAARLHRRRVEIDGVTVTRPRIGRGAIAGALVFGALTVYATASVVPSIRAAHGDGGRTVEIGRSAELVRVEVDHNAPWFFPDTSYYISTPDGTTVVEGGGRPHTGDRYTLYADVLGNRHAVRHGSAAWVWPLLVALIFLLFLAFFVLLLVMDVQERRSASVRPDARTRLAALRGAERIQVLTGGTAFAVTAASDPDVLRVLRRDRIVAASATAVLVLGGGVLVRLHQAGYLSAAPSSRDVVVSQLQGTGWKPLVFADYSEGQEVLVYRATGPLTATITFSRGAVPGGATTLSGLPAGWRGRVEQRTEFATVTVSRRADGRLVTIDAATNYTTDTGAPAQVPLPTLESWVATLARTIDRVGVAALARATARPAHG